MKLALETDNIHNLDASQKLDWVKEVEKDYSLIRLRSGQSELGLEIESCLFNEHQRFMSVEGYLPSDLELELTVNKLDKSFMLFVFNGGNSIQFKLKKGEGKRKIIEPGQFSIFVAQNELKMPVFFQADDKLKLIVLQVDFQLITDKYLCSVNELPQNILELKNGSDVERVYGKVMNAKVREIMQHIFISSKAGLQKRIELEGQCNELFAYALETIGQNRRTYDYKVLDTHTEKSIIEAAEILEKNYANPPIQRELAKRVGLNINKLTHGFRLLFDCSMNDFLRKIRIDKAKAMLNTGKHNVSEVADQVGYSNVSYFIRIFKNQTGQNPGKFVQEILQKN